MNTRSLIRRTVILAAALAIASTVIVGGAGTSPTAQAAEGVKTLASIKSLRTAGPTPNCPTTSNFPISRLYPAVGAPYRGVILCSGSINAAQYYVQVIDLDQGASLRLYSKPISGSGPDAQFLRPDTTEGWFQKIQQGQYGAYPAPSELYSVVNAGYSRNTTPFTSQTAMTFPEIVNFTTTTPGYTFHCSSTAGCPTGSGNEFVQGDWDADKRVLKLGTPPGQTQFASVELWQQHYTAAQISGMAGPNGFDRPMDAVVSFTASSGPSFPNRRTYLGLSNNDRKAYIVTTKNAFSNTDMITLYGYFGVSQAKIIKLDGGGSVEMTTRSGPNLLSEDCELPTCRTLPEVLAIYEGNPAQPDNGLVLGDISHDGREDIIARSWAGGLYRYINAGSGTFPSSNFIGPRWEQFNWFLAGEVNGDGYEDVIAKSYDGKLFLYRHTGNVSAPYNTSLAIGTGWGVYSNIALGDVNPEDGYADIIATKPDGTLWRYINSGNASTPYTVPSQIGSGMQIYNRIKLGDLNRDGLDEIIATKPDGTLWAYTNTATGSLDPAPFSSFQAKQIGSGWAGQNRFAVGDVTGDGFDDIVSTDTNGILWRYTNNHPIPYNGYPILTTPFTTAPTNIGNGWAAGSFN